eukprot:42020-Pyramimonas_sp.AAC.1
MHSEAEFAHSAASAPQIAFWARLAHSDSSAPRDACRGRICAIWRPHAQECRRRETFAFRDWCAENCIWSANLAF